MVNGAQRRGHRLMKELQRLDQTPTFASSCVVQQFRARDQISPPKNPAALEQREGSAELVNPPIAVRSNERHEKSQSIITGFRRCGATQARRQQPVDAETISHPDTQVNGARRRRNQPANEGRPGDCVFRVAKHNLVADDLHSCFTTLSGSAGEGISNSEIKKPRSFSSRPRATHRPARRRFPD